MSALRREGLVNAHDEQLAQVPIPDLRDTPELLLPPDEFCLGVEPQRSRELVAGEAGRI